MKNNEKPIDIDLRFNRIILIQEKNLRYMESLGISPDILQDCRKVISYLKARSELEIIAILNSKNSRRKPSTDQSPHYSDDELSSMDSIKIMNVINSPEVSRNLLERLASNRFGVTKGALSMLGSRDALKDKLTTLLGHEGAHEAITRVVGDSQVLPHKKSGA